MVLTIKLLDENHEGRQEKRKDETRLKDEDLYRELLGQGGKKLQRIGDENIKKGENIHIKDKGDSL